MSKFSEIDKLLESEQYEAAYNELKKKYDGGERSVDVLWRLSYAAADFGLRQHSDKQKLVYINEAINYGAEAVAADEKCYEALKYYAAAMGHKSGMVGSKEKIELGKKMKDQLDKALAINPKCSACLHMRGCFNYNVASLSWMERKIASALYSTVPSATMDDVIADLSAVAQMKPDWMRNNFFLGKAYFDKGDKANAKACFAKVLAGKATMDSERQFQADATKISSKC